MEIDVGIAEIETYGLTVGDNSRARGGVEEWSELAEGPAKAAAGVVGYVPEQIAEPLAPMRLPGGRQVAKQCARLLRWWQVNRFAVPL